MTKLEFFQKKIQRKVPKCQNYRVLSKKFREEYQNTKNTEKMPKYRANIKIQSNRDLCLIYFLKDKGTCKSMDICEVICLIYLAFFSNKSVEGGRSKKRSFFDLPPSTDTIKKQHKNKKKHVIHKHAWTHMYLYLPKK